VSEQNQTLCKMLALGLLIGVAIGAGIGVALGAGLSQAHKR
jgi:hypothetical protein